MNSGRIPAWADRLVAGHEQGLGQDQVNPGQRNRTLALVRAGFEDGPALTVASTDGEIPQGRELSFAWLTGTVMTGLTSVLLMGCLLYTSPSPRARTRTRMPSSA